MQRALSIVGALIFLGACEQAADTGLVPYTITGDAIKAPLTGALGSAPTGKKIFSERERGHCVLCHQVSSLDVPFQGNVGPDLSHVGNRLTAGQIRLRIVDASLANPNTVMPPYYRTTGLNQVAAEHAGTPVLKAEEIEDVIAYLIGLKG